MSGTSVAAPAHPHAPASLDEWRPWATGATLWAALIADFPALLAGLVRDLAWGTRLLYLGLYALLGAMAIARRLDHRLRAGVFLASGYLLAAVGLVRIGLGGSGRMLLLALPLFALLLIGRRAGAGCLAVSILLQAAFTTLAYLELLPEVPAQVAGNAWLTHSVLILMTLVPLGVLLERALAFQEDALRRAQAASARAAAEAEERRRLEREVIEVSEREQLRVGHELHDGLCQQLTAGLLSARLLERELKARQASEAEQAGALAEMVDGALADARSLSRGLSPGPLPAGGLGTALRELARQVRETVEVDCELVGSGAPSAGGADATQLYRIAQEATQNAIKHAEAGRITIELSEDDAEVRLQVRDDGRGLMPSAPPGLGLRSMLGRAVSIGGTLEVAPAEGGGTSVICRVPMVAKRRNRG
ncbi:MAG TPA: ATP-binding protein [Myxococcales bacterium]